MVETVINRAALESGAQRDSVSLVKLADTAALDAFGRQRVSSPYILFDNKFLSSKNHHMWDEELWGCVMVHGAVTGTFTVGQKFTGPSGYAGIISTILSPTSFTFYTDDNSVSVGAVITTATGSATVVSNNTGTDVVFNRNRASVQLKVGTIQGQRAIRQTYRYFPYMSGCSQLINTTKLFNTPKVGLRQTVMYGDDLNGLGLVVDGLSINILKRSDTTGVVVNTMIPQSEWNLDDMSGFGPEHGNPSGIKLDINHNQIFIIDFQWLGVGRVRYGFNIDGITYYVHELKHANTSDGVYIGTPSLPVRYEIENVGTTDSPSTLEQICCVVSSEGGISIPGISFSVSNGITERTLVGGVRTPILALRLKSKTDNGGIETRKTVKFLNSGLFARAADIFFEIVHVHELRSITCTWASVDDSSQCEYTTDITAFTAHHVHRLDVSMVPTGGSTQASGHGNIDLAIIDANTTLSQNIPCDNSNLFLVYATSRSGTAYATAHITFTEIE